MKKSVKTRKKSKSLSVYQIFSELIESLGHKYSSQFLYDHAEKIFKLYLRNTKLNDGYGRANLYSRNYFCKDVSCLIENDPWLPVYNEKLDNIETSYNHNHFLRELGVR